MSNIHLDSAKKHDIWVLFDVTEGNPNGDPDNGNMPRFNPHSRHGFATDVSYKRKIRNYVHQVLGQPIFIQNEWALNDLIKKAAKDKDIKLGNVEVEEEDFAFLDWLKANITDESDAPFQLDVDGHEINVISEKKHSAKDIQKVLENLIQEEQFSENESQDAGETETAVTLEEIKAAIKKYSASLAKNSTTLKHDDRQKVRSKMIQDYWDIRMFGAVLSTGLNAGQVMGPVQFSFAKSVDKIFPRDHSITRTAITKAEDKKKKDTEMGRDARIHYGLYQVNGFYNPYLGSTELSKLATGVKQSDLEKLYEAITNMQELHHTHTSGHQAVRAVLVFTHENPKGNCHTHKLFENIVVNAKDGIEWPQSFDDYKEITVFGKKLSELKMGEHTKENIEKLPEGITLTVLAGGKEID